MEKDLRNDHGPQLIRLEELKGFKVADGDRDIRGWKVRTSEGVDAGKVDELIVDPSARQVRYLEIDLDKKAVGLDDDRRILVPIGVARLDDDHERVVVDQLSATKLAAAPLYRRGSITREYETSLRDYYGARGRDGEDFYRDDIYNDSAFRSSSTEGIDRGAQPRFGDNEVTIPLRGDQEIIVRRPGSDEEIVIRKSGAAGSKPPDEERV